jgi:DNA replication protein DnaC
MSVPLPLTIDTAELATRVAALGWRSAPDALPAIMATNKHARPVLEAIAKLVTIETNDRHTRSLERRRRRASIGPHTVMAGFDWNWPTSIDRGRIESTLALGFVTPGDNIIISGPHGVGKTTILRNIAHQSVLAGHTVAVSTAQKMLQDLASIDSPSRLKKAISQLASFDVLCIDELGYLSYSDRAADLFYDIVNRRYEARRSIVLTTNLKFVDWGSIFPNATCTGAIIERLIHRADLLTIDGHSWRLKEAEQRANGTLP